MEKIISLDELYATESYKNNGKIFPHPKEFIAEFAKIVEDKFEVQGQCLRVDKEGGAGTEDDENILTYGRGLLQYVLPSGSDAVGMTIGLIWSYDTSKWAVKVFRGVNVFACTNYMVAGAEDIYEKLFRKTKGKGREGNLLWKHECEIVTSNILDKTDEYVATMLDMYNRTISFIKLLKETIYKGKEIEILIGSLYINDVIKGVFDYSTFSEGCRLIFNDKYLHGNKSLYELVKEDGLSLWQLYNALTQRITDGGTIPIDGIPNKTLEITNLLEKEIITNVDFEEN